ncbi:hypothetical protein CHS0354_030567 [Potamilus streckersoni]|uniref:1-acylglycerol-3-phosphate O-acyltransferase ABHD5 n=1 Tax=Potamilus streckersoni TaxID=2493646 RepID=A0AAE0S3C5_9BIVA|nr:hypothetical protein CHS0354_030567 [Potamilus streckersoni]
MSRFVFLPQSRNRLWTIIVNQDKDRIPLVMLHGMGGGVGLWAQNIDALSAKRPLYAFDLLGFGQSSRPEFDKDAQLAEMEFVDSVEEWRQEMQLDKMVLLGHSLGAFIASSYALKYPERIKHLILVDPWGFPEKPPDNERAQRIPMWVRMIGKVVQLFNPLAILRAAGPLGPVLVRRFRSDFQKKFSNIIDDDTIFEYIYHCNAQEPSGERAFKTLSMSFGWAINPMIKRIQRIEKSIPMTLIYGSRSWITHDTGDHVRLVRNDSYVDVQVIRGAGHHVYADEPQAFNTLVQNILDNIDSSQDDTSSQSRPPADKELPQEESNIESVPITEF